VPVFTVDAGAFVGALVGFGGVAGFTVADSVGCVVAAALIDGVGTGAGSGVAEGGAVVVVGTTVSAVVADVPSGFGAR
jgi:hypothetical protein